MSERRPVAAAHPGRAGELPDAQAVPRAMSTTQDDGTPAFDEFVAACSTRLLRTSYLLTRDHALAEDLLQTALTKAWFAWKRIDRDPEPYVRKILVNTYASWWRRKWNGEEPSEALPERGYAGDGDRHADRHDLWQAMGRLPRRQRAVIVLRYFEDLTEAETARALDCSVGTVKSQTSKALARLRLDPAVAPATTDLFPEGGDR